MLFRLLASLTLVALIVACGPSAPDASDPRDEQVEGAWVLESGSVGGAPVPVVEGHGITLTVEGSRISGTAACNSYGGIVEPTADGIRFDELVQTDMGCEPEVQASEQTYMAGLAAVGRIGRDGEHLVLTGPEVELRFVVEDDPTSSERPEEAPDAHASDPGDEQVEGAWVLKSGSVGGAPVPILADHRITLIIDGSRAGGTATCNSYGGTIVPAPGGIRLDELHQTLIGCAPDVQASEQAYLTGLAAVNGIGRDGEELVLIGPEVELRFAALPPVPTADLVDTTWMLESIIAGDVAASPVGAPATLELRSDGSLIGSTGCQSFRGTWTESGDEVLTTRFEIDAVECPAALQRQDSHVLGVVGRFRAEVQGDVLTIRSDAERGLLYRAGND